MNSWAADAKVDELIAKSRKVKPGRVLLTVLTAVGVAIGWAVGRFFLSLGWLGGRIWLTGAYFAETVIFGFREGAKIPQPVRAEGPPPGAQT